MVSNSRNNPPRHPSGEPSLDMLALAEWLAELRAAGDTPRLSALIAALSDAAGDLADATMLDALMAEAEAADLQMAEGRPDVEGTPEEATSLALSPGAQRAVADIFGAGDAGDAGDALAMVAETPASYGITIEADADESLSLLALAHGQGMNAETLAAQIMLSPDVLHWLDRVALPLDQQPDALVFHLVGALGAPRERVREALAIGNAAAHADKIDAGAGDLADVLTTSASLTTVQRAYWAAQLAGHR